MSWAGVEAFQGMGRDQPRALARQSPSKPTCQPISVDVQRSRGGSGLTARTSREIADRKQLHPRGHRQRRRDLRLRQRRPDGRVRRQRDDLRPSARSRARPATSIGTSVNFASRTSPPRAGLDRGRAGRRACAWATYDNDGHRDLFVTHYGREPCCTGNQGTARSGTSDRDGRRSAGTAPAGRPAARSSTTTSMAGSISP